VARRRRFDGLGPVIYLISFITTVRGVKGLLGLSPLGLISRLLRGQVNLSI